MRPPVIVRLRDVLTRRAAGGGSPVPRPLERRVVSDLRVREFTSAVSGDQEMFARLMAHDELFAAIVRTGYDLGRSERGADR